MLFFSKLKLLYQNKVSSLGTGMILVALFLFLPLALTFDDMLIPLEGTIKSANSSSEIVSHKERFGNQRLSRNSTLIFTLNEYNKTFILESGAPSPLYNGNTENDKISSYLEGSKNITVWIKGLDKKEITPEIFKIDIDGRNEYNYKGKRFRSQITTFFLLLFGLFFIYLGDKFQKTL
ncbi:hypothetical protein [Flavobacterium tistrianum]|uniref:hypothetical protein n=1 Tax=Flavobacterium tistrianum TaxID=1685414 RepID=UPI000DAE2547|nr:hypothetical protein [Flavobacterium tistrianum]KAF2338104.1 hypothetical protein DMB71_18925 [Flavobacterium tistrianum]